MSLFIPSFSVLLIKENDRLKMMKIVGIRRVQRRRSKKQKKTKEERRRNWKRNFNFELNSSIMAVIKNKTEIVRRLLLFLFKTGINVAVSGNFIEQCGAFSAVL